jgi:hypothetical protein
MTIIAGVAIVDVVGHFSMCPIRIRAIVLMTTDACEFGIAGRVWVAVCAARPGATVRPCINGEIETVMIERGVVPPRCRMTIFTSRGKTRRSVVGVCRRLVFRPMAGIAIRRSVRITSGVTEVTCGIGVRPGERPTGHGFVIETRWRPG